LGLRARQRTVARTGTCFTDRTPIEDHGGCRDRGILVRFVRLVKLRDKSHFLDLSLLDSFSAPRRL